MGCRLILVGESEGSQAIARAYQEVLFAVEHIGGRSVSDTAWKISVPEDFAIGRVEGDQV